MYPSVIQRIAKAYGLEPSRISGPQKGYRNESYALDVGAERLNLMLFKQESGMADRIRRANYVADFAAGTGLPARRTARPQITQLTAGPYTKYAALYTYLPGSNIPWEGYTQIHLKLLGQSLGTLHNAVRSLAQRNLPNVEDEQLEVLHRMADYFANTGVKNAMTRKLGLHPPALGKYEKLLAATRRLSDKQPLHMDFVRGNILFAPAGKRDVLQLNGLAVSGILDFEKTAYGPRWYDIARTCAFLLVDCKYKTPAQVRKYFLFSGYQKRGELTLPPHQKLLEPLTDFFLLHDFYKFLRHNPYEYLDQNEHFMRTRELLVQRGLLP